MYTDKFDQSYEQVMLANQWKNTKERRRHDEEIDRDRKRVITDRKRVRQ